MNKTLKRMAAGLLVVLLAGAVTPGERQRQPALVSPRATLRVPPALAEAVQEAERSGDPFVDVDMVAATAGDMERIGEAVAAVGGEVLLQEQTYARVRVPAAVAEALPPVLPVVAVGTNERLALEQAQNILSNPVQAADAAGLADLNLQVMGTAAFRREHGVSGRGVKVAVIDSGVDPGHPALKETEQGTSKVVDWKDFTGEGLVKTPHSVPWAPAGTFVTPDGARYQLPAGSPGSAGTVGRFGYWDEVRISGILDRDLNRNGSQADLIGVLLVDSLTPGVFDTAYVDTNNNRDFGDEEPLQLFRTDRKSYGALGNYRTGPQALQRLNFVAADIDPAGRFVVFGFDGVGHGTQVAGVLGANDPRGYQGVAPGVEIMALKVVSSDGVVQWFAIADAVQYAAERGASVINISLAGLAVGSRTDKTAPELFNRIARRYGVLIVLAAGNTGPGLSSGATIGNPTEVLTVGSYYSPAMWMRDFGYVVPSEGVYWESGMGPRSDGSYLPGVIAPGGSPTPISTWLTATGYTSASGTSLAAPHVAGAAALLMEAGRRTGSGGDWQRVKRSLELGARPIPDLAAFEQGRGVVSLKGAMEYLTQIEAVPVLTARSSEGNSGLLARSYRPGSTEFTLTNLDPGVARVSVISSDPWVTPTYKSLSLPQNVSRQLPLQMTPPTQPGVHSSLITVNHHGRFGQNLVIPVTFVRPLEFKSRSNSAYTTADRLEVGRFRRYFFEVLPGATRFDLSVRMSPGLANTAQGTARVYVFRPDGQMVHQSPDIGVNGKGLATLFQGESPLAGVWEVVVFARPDRDGAYLNAGYTLDASTGPPAFPGVPVQLSQPAGSTVTHTINVTNSFPGFTGGVEAAGLTRNDTSQPWKVISHRSTVDDFTVSEWVWRMRIEIANPVTREFGPEPDLDLFLDRIDSTTPRGLVTVAQARTKGSAREVIEVRDLPPGRYIVSAIANGSVPRSLQYQYRRLMGIEGFHLSVEDPVRRHETRDTWTARVTVQAPASPGRYTGYLLLRDTEKDDTITWLPFEVSVGQPGVSVEALVPQLTSGRTSTVILELRDIRSGQLLDGTLEVNGQRFSTRSGRAIVPVEPAGTMHTLKVEVNLPKYAYFTRGILLPVASAWAPHPVGVGPAQENSLWRRKIISQWP